MAWNGKATATLGFVLSAMGITAAMGAGAGARLAFQDDVVIRIAPTADNGSRVDIRSVSRVGLSDVGTNARRIRAFLKKFAEASKNGGTLNPRKSPFAIGINPGEQVTTAVSQQSSHLAPTC